jgi:hypothetical protein
MRIRVIPTTELPRFFTIPCFLRMPLLQPLPIQTDKSKFHKFQVNRCCGTRFDKLSQLSGQGGI